MVLVLEMDLGLGVEVGIEVVWVVINAKFPILLDPAIRVAMKRCLIPRYYFPPYILPLLTISIMNLYEFLSFIYLRGEGDVFFFCHDKKIFFKYQQRGEAELLVSRASGTNAASARFPGYGGGAPSLE